MVSGHGYRAVAKPNQPEIVCFLDRMLLGLGHAEIFRVAEKYIHRNAITTDEMEDLEKYLYKPYSELGGNGTAQAIVEKCKQLPIITAAEAERLDTEGLRHE